MFIWGFTVCARSLGTILELCTGVKQFLNEIHFVIKNLFSDEGVRYLNAVCDNYIMWMQLIKYIYKKHNNEAIVF